MQDNSVPIHSSLESYKAGEPASFFVSREKSREMKKQGYFFVNHGKEMCAVKAPVAEHTREHLTSNVLDVRDVSCNPGVSVIEAFAEHQLWAGRIMQLWA